MFSVKWHVMRRTVFFDYESVTELIAQTSIAKELTIMVRLNLE